MAAQVVMQHFQKPWQLLVSVCLTRLSVISSELSDLEKRYATLQSELEYERSVLNDYEVRMNELVLKDGRKNKDLSEAEEAEVLEASRELATLQDQEEVWGNDFKKVKVADRITPADTNDEKTTTFRKLDEVLHYVVPDNKILNQNSLVYPYTTVEQNETLKDASFRILNNHNLNQPNILFLSNAPVGVLKIRYNQDEKRGNHFQGAKMFFTQAVINSRGGLQHETDKDHQWLSLTEFQQTCNSDYFNRVQNFVA